MLASEMGKLILLGTNKRCAFTYKGVRYTGTLMGKSISEMSDIWNTDEHGIVTIPWGTPDTIDKMYLDCEVDVPPVFKQEYLQTPPEGS
jgi:hypothetical protein